ncbi:hypothetical protein ES705_14332 [subsurface metagenome]
MAMEELINYSFNILHLHQLYCNISAKNKASLSVFKKAGFSICGTKREWLKSHEGFVDEVLLQLINSSY